MEMPELLNRSSGIVDFIPSIERVGLPALKQLIMNGLHFAGPSFAGMNSFKKGRTKDI
jgi:hypothetical protein